MSTPETLDDYVSRRLTWPSFVPLKQLHVTKAQLSTLKSLSDEIMDKHYDSRLRNADFDNVHIVHEYFKESICNPAFTQMIAEDAGLEVLESFVMPHVAIKTRENLEFRVTLHVESTIKGMFPTEKNKMIEKEKKDYNKIAQFITKEKWYIEMFDKKQIIDEFGFHGPRLDMKLSYKAEVSDQLLIGLLFRVSCKVCPYVEPLLFFWQSLMTEDDDLWLTDNSNWLEIEITSLLVIFFLQQCRLVPLFLRHHDELLPANLTLDIIRRWSEGERFFKKDIFNETRRLVKKSPFFGETLGGLFVELLHFYTDVCSLDTMKICFDSGTYQPLDESEKNLFIIESVLIRSTDKSHKDNFPKKKMYVSIMKKFIELLENEDFSVSKGSVADKMIEIRRNVEEASTS